MTRKIEETLAGSGVEDKQEILIRQYIGKSDGAHPGVDFDTLRIRYTSHTHGLRDVVYVAFACD